MHNRGYLLLPVRGSEFQVDPGVEYDECGERNDPGHDQLVPPRAEGDVVLVLVQRRRPVVRPLLSLHHGGGHRPVGAAVPAAPVQHQSRGPVQAVSAEGVRRRHGPVQRVRLQVELKKPGEVQRT